MLNPIKTPQEMLLEETGLPHYAGGGSAFVEALAPGARQMVENAIKRYMRVYGKPPAAHEVAALEQEAAKLSKPTSTMEGANVARMRAQEPYANKFVDEMGRVYEPGAGAQYGVPNPYKIPTPGERNYGVSKPRWVPDENGGGSFVRDDQLRTAFDPRDNFLTSQINQDATKQTRTNKTTSQVPYAMNIDEMQGQARSAVGSPNQPLEALDNGPGPMQRSTEPSYDPHDIDYADDAPVSSMTLRGDVTPGASAIAQMAERSTVPHDYTGQGLSSMADLVNFRKSLPPGAMTKDARALLKAKQEHALNSGVTPSAVSRPPSELGRFKSIMDEVEMGPPGPEASMGGYAAGGHLTPTDMILEMGARGHNVKRYADGGNVMDSTQYDQMGMPISSSPLGQEISGPTRTAAMGLQNLAAMPIAAGMGAANTIAGAAQMAGYDQPAQAMNQINNGLAQTAPTGTKIGQGLGAMLDPATMGVMKASGAMAPGVKNFATTTGLGAAQGYAGTVDGDESRFEHAAGNAIFDTALAGLGKTGSKLYKTYKKFRHKE